MSVGVGKDILNVEDISSLEDYRDLLVKIYPKSEGEIDDLIRISLINMIILSGLQI